MKNGGTNLLSKNVIAAMTVQSYIFHHYFQNLSTPCSSRHSAAWQIVTKSKHLKEYRDRCVNAAAPKR